MHADREAAHFPGRSCLAHAWEIRRMIIDEEISTLIDYGCGLGRQYSEERVHDWWGVTPTLYDPAVPEFAEKPDGDFDGAICTDVLEHVPEEELDDLLAEIYGYARKAVFFTICCRKAKRCLPDGKNCHVTIRPTEWWHQKLRRQVKMSPEPRPKLVVRFTP